jgi:hypothetical protein
MRSSITIFALLFFVSCGKFKVDGKTKNKVDVESYNHVIVNLEYIKDIKLLCQELHPTYEQPNKAARAKIVAQCTLDRMDLISFDALTKFNTDICGDPKTVQEIEACDLLK